MAKKAEKPEAAAEPTPEQKLAGAEATPEAAAEPTPEQKLAGAEATPEAATAAYHAAINSYEQAKQARAAHVRESGAALAALKREVSAAKHAMLRAQADAPTPSS